MELLLKYGADLMDLDKKKMTPLMVAALHGRYNAIKSILDKSRDSQYLNFRGEEGLTALHYAVIKSHEECVSLFFSDPLIQKDKETLSGMNVLHLAAGVGHVGIVSFLL